MKKETKCEDCNDCYFYNAYDGYCCHKKKAKEPHHGYDPACELAKYWETGE